MTNLLRVVAVLCMALAAVTAWRSSSASAQAESARVRTGAVAQRLAEIAELRGAQATALVSSRPTESVSAAVRSSLSAASLGDGVLRSISPSGDETVPGEGSVYRRQHIAVTLAPLTPAQLGAFLAAWQKAEPQWTVSRIDLGHQGPDTEPTFQANLTLTTTYLAPSPTAATTARLP